MAEQTEIFLNPGEFHFGGPGDRVQTILGSCVAITMWHPGRRIGGMCHILLPGHAPLGHAAGFDGRYAHDALQLFLRELDRYGTRPDEYEVKLFGGADQFPELGEPVLGDVAGQNIHAALTLLDEHGFVLSTRQVGGTGARRLVFELGTGAVWVRSLDPYVLPEGAQP